jgi:hypothetical protein
MCISPSSAPLARRKDTFVQIAEQAILETVLKTRITSVPGKGERSPRDPQQVPCFNQSSKTNPDPMKVKIPLMLILPS